MSPLLCFFDSRLFAPGLALPALEFSYDDASMGTTLEFDLLLFLVPVPMLLVDVCPLERVLVLCKGNSPVCGICGDDDDVVVVVIVAPLDNSIASWFNACDSNVFENRRFSADLGDDILGNCPYPPCETIIFCVDVLLFSEDPVVEFVGISNACERSNDVSSCSLIFVSSTGEI